MPVKTLPQFLLAVAVCACIVTFHLGVGLVAARRVGNAPERPVRFLLAALVLALDAPVVYAMLVYKFYHPLALDNVMKAIAVPLVVLHVNALIGAACLLADVVVKHRLRKKYGQKTPAKIDATQRVHRFQPVHPADMQSGRRLFLRNSAVAVTVGTFGTMQTLRAIADTKNHRLERVVVKIPNLPEPLKGTTIAMIADVHSSVFMDKAEMEIYKNELMKLKADMIVVAGDFVNSKQFEVYAFAEAFSGMSAPLGVWGVTGNHDYYTGRVEDVAREIEQCGIKLLRNANVPITKDGATMYLMGIDDDDVYDVRQYLNDGKTTKGTVENMLKGIPDGAPRIMMCHKPYPFEEYSQVGLDLMLSGHTHGGQVVIAQLDTTNVSFAALASQYVAGLYKGHQHPAAQLYVTRGVGTVGIPVRVNCPPEITHITLV